MTSSDTTPQRGWALGARVVATAAAWAAATAAATVLSAPAQAAPLPAGVVQVPFAVESVGYGTLETSQVPRSLTRAVLRQIYQRDISQGCLFAPLVPTAGSGTREHWASALGLTSSAIGVPGGFGTCVKDVSVTGAALIENDARFLTGSAQLIPISTAQFVANSSGTTSDVRGRASLSAIDWDDAGAAAPLPALAVNPAFVAAAGSSAPSFLTRVSSSVPRNLSMATLRQVYQRNTSQGACLFAPLVPAAGTPTRQAWADLLGLTSTAIGAPGGFGTCVQDTTAAGAPIVEGDARFLTGGTQILPFLPAAFVAMSAGQASDLRGGASLGAIDFTGTGSTAEPALTSNDDFGLGNRTLTNAVRTDEAVAGSALAGAVLGSGAAVCTTGAPVIRRYGYHQVANCGATS